jgi:hypothetical protein
LASAHLDAFIPGELNMDFTKDFASWSGVLALYGEE